MIFVEITATVLGLLQGFFALLNKKSNWIFYGLQMLCMIVFSLKNKLYGDVLNSSVYLLLGVYGFVFWSSEKAQITECSKQERAGYVLLILMGTFIVFFVLRGSDDPLPFLDAFTTTSSFVATYYMVLKKIDTWFIWLINDIFYIVQYAMLEQTAYYLMMLNIIWSVMAVASLFNWYRIMKGRKI